MLKKMLAQFLRIMRLLTKMLAQYCETHGHPPRKIVVAPIASVALALKGSLSPIWAGIPVEFRLFNQDEIVPPGSGSQLGIFLKKGAKLALVACDLR